MSRADIQPFIDLQQPVTLTIKKTRTIYDHATVTLDHFYGRCVVSTAGEWFRTSRIKGIARVATPAGVAT